MHAGDTPLEGSAGDVFSGRWEQQIDVALDEACTQDAGFVRWFVGVALPSLLLPDEFGPCHVALNRWEACPDGGAGENDVTLTIPVRGGPLVVRVENKVGARFMPRQGERYRQRARHHGGFAVLVAPRGRLLVRKSREVFDGTVALEDLIEALARFGFVARAADLGNVLANAQRPRDPHLPTLAFNSWLEQQLEARGVDWLSVAGNTTEKQGWPYMQLPAGFFQPGSRRPDGNILIYKAGFSGSAVACVDVTERHLPPAARSVIAQLGLPHGFVRARDQKHNDVIRRQVRPVAVADGSPEPGSERFDAAVEAVDAIVVAAGWLLALADQMPALPAEVSALGRGIDAGWRRPDADGTEDDELLVRITAGWAVRVRRSKKGNLLLDRPDGTGNAVLNLYSHAGASTRLQLDPTMLSSSGRAAQARAAWQNAFGHGGHTGSKPATDVRTALRDFEVLEGVLNALFDPARSA